MTIEGDIQALLNPLATGGCYPIMKTDESGVDDEYITFTVISDTPIKDLDGPGRVQKRIQIDAFARTYGRVKTISNNIKAVILGSYPNSSTPIQYQDLYEEGVKSYRVILDYYIWEEN